MGKAKTKAANREPAQDKPQKERLLPVSRAPGLWKVGDLLVVETNAAGYVSKSKKITKIETGQGCKNLHVNDTACYDRSKPCLIAVPESEALLIYAGIDLDEIAKIVMVED